MARELLTSMELAERLSISRAVLYRWKRDGLIPQPIKIGRDLRWPDTVVDEIIAQHSKGGAA